MTRRDASYSSFARVQCSRHRRWVSPEHLNREEIEFGLAKAKLLSAPWQARTLQTRVPLMFVSQPGSRIATAGPGRDRPADPPHRDHRLLAAQSRADCPGKISFAGCGKGRPVV